MQTFLSAPSSPTRFSVAVYNASSHPTISSSVSDGAG